MTDSLQSKTKDDWFIDIEDSRKRTTFPKSLILLRLGDKEHGYDYSKSDTGSR